MNKLMLGVIAVAAVAAAPAVAADLRARPVYKSAPPPPGPGLWQIHGVAKVGSPFNLLSLASVKGPTHQRMQLTARGDGQSLVVSETSGCRRTARLSRS